MNLAAELKVIEEGDLEQLRSVWRRHYGVPPKLRSATLLRSIIAWRLQMAAEGGLDATSRNSLLRERSAPEALLEIGTVVSREWKGARHEVEITEDGPYYAGKHWKSLSQVARAITGSRWNGPRFFGLRQSS